MKKSLAGLVLAFSLVSFLPSVVLAKITYSPDGNYAIVTGQNMKNADWNTAAADVLSTLGNEWHLATITSHAEQDYVLNLMKTESVHELWLGAYQKPLTTTDPKANWTWVTGELWDYTNWGGVEPNDGFGPGSEQHLAIVNGGAWNDEGYVFNITGYVAERYRHHGVVPGLAVVMLFSIGIISTLFFWIRAKRKK